MVAPGPVPSGRRLEGHGALCASPSEAHGHMVAHTAIARREARHSNVSEGRKAGCVEGAGLTGDDVVRCAPGGRVDGPAGELGLAARPEPLPAGVATEVGAGAAGNEASVGSVVLADAGTLAAGAGAPATGRRDQANPARPTVSAPATPAAIHNPERGRRTTDDEASGSTVSSAPAWAPVRGTSRKAGSTRAGGPNDGAGTSV